jgi:hypothetical protein
MIPPMLNRILLLLLLLILGGTGARAAAITGTVTDDKGNILPFSSVFVKGTTKGVTANHEGKYVLDLDPGNYIVVCQYVGYTRQEKKVTLVAGQPALVLDFQLSLQQLSLAEAVVRPGGEDPAYAIIRHAIKKRKDYEAPLDSFTCEAYIKTLVRTRKLPAKIMGKQLQQKDRDQMGVDSVGKGILYLSESLTKLSFKKPGKLKLEVLSGRESGTNGFGFGVPTFVNFYDNNVTVISRELNPRGFISPIAESALNYYHYKYLGSFWEDGKEINKIQVIPRRKYEPLFSGTINIVEGEWRIHSLDLLLLRQSQLEVLDTLEIRQLQVPVAGRGAGTERSGGADPVGAVSRVGGAGDVWMTKDQVIYFTFNFFGVDGVGNFLNVYNKYELAPQFHKKFFNNVLIRFDTAVNKKGRAYWDSVRPVPLEPDEVKNYKTKDSVYDLHKDSIARSERSLKFRLGSPLAGLQYNTVEGLNLHLGGTFSKTFQPSGRTLSVSPNIRYGFHNTHLNAWGKVTLSKRTFSMQGDDASFSRQRWTFSGGRRVSQFDPDNPISETVNSLYTLIARENYMKIYENVFGELLSSSRLDNGLRITVNALYEDRMPLDNTTNYSLFHPRDGTLNPVQERIFTPNYPVEQLGAQFPRHQALTTGVTLEYQPGQLYIELPHNKISIGSKYPTMSLSYQRGWKDLFGSDVDYDKWQFSVWDDANFKLKGLLRYRLSIGGFLNTRSVYIQDYQHFNGNQTIFESEYLNSFQLAPYYANSTTAALYATGHIEHHFNGFLTNQIPLFKRLSWWLVGGSNAFYVNRDNNYVEVFGGLENIFKLFRVDLVASYLDGRSGQVGFRVGLGGLLQGSMRRR